MNKISTNVQPYTDTMLENIYITEQRAEENWYVYMTDLIIQWQFTAYINMIIIYTTSLHFVSLIFSKA